MTNIFFQFSNGNYLQAMRVYDNPGKDFAIRIVSFHNGQENYFYLPDVTLNELSILASILHLKFLPNLNTSNDMRNNIYQKYNYYS